MGDHFRRDRLRVPQAVQAMTQSLRRGGQCAPLGATLRQERPQGLDGFTRWEAAPQVRGMTTHLVRLIAGDDPRAQAAMDRRNQTGRRPREREEAGLVQALGREDGVSPSAVAALLGRHKSWVGRRLASLEERTDDVRQDLEVGLWTPAAARESAPVPAGNQAEVLDRSRREALSREGLGGVVRLLRGAVTAAPKLFVMTQPRDAPGPAGAAPREGWDPRRSARGNRVSQQSAALLDRRAWAEDFLQCRGWTALKACGRRVLGPVVARLSRDATCGAEGAGDLAVEMNRS